MYLIWQAATIKIEPVWSRRVRAGRTFRLSAAPFRQGERNGRAELHGSHEISIYLKASSCLI